MVTVKGSKIMGVVSAIGGVEACGARWTLGALLLAPLAAANSSYCALMAVLLLGIFSAVAAFTCRDLKQLATILPPSKTSRGRRERNLRSFGDFMTMWMSFLAHLVAVAICARILSATADHVTGGRTRRWLFGYETRSLGEPWPDVLGVTVVMVVCGMFMCGLEENFTFKIMLMIFLYLFTQFFAIFGLLHLDIGNVKIPFPITIYELFAAGAPISYAFCVVLPKDNAPHNLKKYMILIVGLPTLVLFGLCFFYTNMLKGNSIDAALPVTTLLEARSADWMCPILAAVTVSGVCLALTDLCPLLFNILVSLASPEWKVLTRSMTYESVTTGSPVLAVFTAGSLAAILAFACPLAHMITLMNASHLLGITIQAFHFIIMRCVPTLEQKEAGDIEYKRLGNEGTSKGTKSSAVKQSGKRGLWFIPSAIRHTKTLESIKSKVIKEAEERECLLLNEYSGCTTEELEPTRGSSATMATPEVDDGASDIEASEPEMSSGDDSTDIDAVVKEYRDTIQVVTSIPEAPTPQLPSLRGARWSAVGALIQFVADILIAVAFCNETVRLYMFIAGIPLWLCGALLSSWQPAHALSMRRCQSAQGSVTMLIALLLLTPLLIDSWPAIILFAGAGVVIYARCERWCGDLAVTHARSSMEHKKLHPVSSAVPITGGRLAHIDTVYIAR